MRYAKIPGVHKSVSRVIQGSPMIVYFSYDPEHWRPLPFLTAIRWKRLFSMPR